LILKSRYFKSGREDGKAGSNVLSFYYCLPTCRRTTLPARKIKTTSPLILKRCLFIFFIISCLTAGAQQTNTTITPFLAKDSVRVTIDKSPDHSKRKKTIITFFALPNGNTTEQTMGKKMQEGDDWHFDIQHIRAQTKFIRREMPQVNFVVIYL
jgi:hypothetical protein